MHWINCTTSQWNKRNVKYERCVIIDASIGNVPVLDALMKWVLTTLYEKDNGHNYMYTAYVRPDKSNYPILFFLNLQT